MNLVRNTSYNLLGAAIPIIVALVTIPIYLGIIGAAKFGLLSIAFLILGYFGIFDLGLGRAVAHRVASTASESETTQSGIVSTAIVCNLLLGLVGGAALWIFSYLYFEFHLDVDETLRGQMVNAIPALVVSVPVTALTGVLSGALEGRGKFLTVNLVSASTAILFHVLPLTLALNGISDLQHLILAACITRIAGVIMLYVFCMKEFGFVRRIVQDEIPKLFKFGGWVALSSIVGPLMIITDRFAIGALLGPTAVANYTIPFEIASRTSAVPQALGRALFPQITSRTKAQSVHQLSHQSSLILASIITPLTVAGIFWMEPFLNLWLGNFAPETVKIGQIILVSFWVNAMSYVPLTVILGNGRPKIVAITHCIELIPYLAILYFLVSRFGIQGAALAFLLRCVFDYLILSWMSGLLSRMAIPHATFALIVGSAFSVVFFLKTSIVESAFLTLVFVFLIFASVAIFGKNYLRAMIAVIAQLRS